MSTQRQIRRGTQAENDAFTGAAGETVYTTDTKRLINHDGSTTGGIPVPNYTDTQNNLFIAADGSGTNTITVTLATLGKAPSAYVEYQSFTFKPANNNTGAVTINFDSLGAKDVKKDDGSGALVALEADDLKQNIPVTVIYDGTQFIALISAAGGGDVVRIGALVASNDASLDFTSMLDNTVYSSYYFIFDNIIPITNSAALRMRYSINNGISFISGANTYESSYNTTVVSGTTDTTWNMVADTNKTYIQLTDPDSLVAAQVGSGIFGRVDLFGFKTTGITELSNKAVWNVGINLEVYYGYGRGDAVSAFTTDIDAVQFFVSTGNIDSGTITLYGVKR